MSTPQLSKHVLDALKQWHDDLVEKHICIADNEGQACCIDRLMPDYVPSDWEKLVQS